MWLRMVGFLFLAIIVVLNHIYHNFHVNISVGCELETNQTNRLWFKIKQCYGLAIQAGSPKSKLALQQSEKQCRSCVERQRRTM